MRGKLRLILIIVVFVVATKAQATNEASTPTESDKTPFSHNPVYFELLANYELSLLENLSHLKIVNPPEELFAYLKSYKKSLGKIKSTPSSVAENPNLTFQLLWRVVKHLSPLLNKVATDRTQKALRDVVVKPENINLPTLLDLEDFVERIGILQNMFDLKPKDMMIGKFRDINTGAKLSYEQALFLANSSLIFHHFHVTKDWLDYLESRQIVKLSEDERKEARSALSSIRERLIEEHDSNFNQYSMGGYPYMYNKRMANQTKLLTALEEEIREWVEIGGTTRLLRAKIIKAAAICRNSSVYKFREPANFRTLKCHFGRKHPYFLLHPAKVEILADSPEVILYHNVLHEKELSLIEKEQDKENDLQVDTKPLPIIQRIENLLSLKIDSESISKSQFVVEETAGYQKPNHDAHRAEQPMRLKVFADKLATIQFFFSNPQLGGEVIFTDIPLVVKPQRGSMLYWENYDENGRVEWRTFYGDCPVVLGRNVRWTVHPSLEKNRAGKFCKAS